MEASWEENLADTLSKYGDAYEGKWTESAGHHRNIYFYINNRSRKLYTNRAPRNSVVYSVDLHTGEELWDDKFLT